MSVIQKIREKYATVMILAICLSLVAFLLMDALVGPRSLFHHSDMVADINGHEIDYAEFSSREQQAEAQARSQNPNSSLTDAQTQQIQDNLWNQILSENILGDEYAKLGIAVTDEEFVDLTASPDADPTIKSIPQFQDPKTGQFDPSMVSQFVRSIDQDPTGRTQMYWDQIRQYIENSTPQRKFYALVSQGLYTPRWLAAMNISEQQTNATISYVSVPYSTIPDSSIPVSDQEMRQYLASHRSEFHQDASRSLEFVSFDAIPSSADTQSLVSGVMGQVPDMKKADTSALPAFINQNSDIPFNDAYITADQILAPNRDSLISLPDGGMLGPYWDNGSLTLARMMDKRTLPDTVRIRHILISTQNIPDSVASNRIDSIVKAIQGGASFAAMVEKYSNDLGSKQTGGEYTFSAAQIQDPKFTPQFRRFIFFDGKKGDKKIVQGSLGYFYIEILDQRDFQPFYKIAFLSRHLDPSQETDNEIFSQASQFAGINRTRAAFEKSAVSQKLALRVADHILATDYQINSMGQARSVVQWAFNDAHLGDVSSVFNLDNKYVVAVLTGIQREGTSSLNEVRLQVSAEIRQKEKGQEIAAKLGSISSLKALSTRLSLPVQSAQNLNFSTPYMPGAGFEPHVIGEIFNKSLGINKISPAIPGNNGVYMIEVDSLKSQPVPQNLLSVQQSLEEIDQQDFGTQLFNMLKKTSKITDNRIKFQ